MLSCFSHVRLCDPMDCSPPGSSVHGILQARILEWVATLSCRGSSWPRDRSPCLLWFLNCRWTLYPWTTGEVELLICNTRKVEILLYIRKNWFLFCSIFISASLPAPSLVINLLVLTRKTPILGVFVSTVGKFWHLFGYQLCANSSYDCQITTNITKLDMFLQGSRSVSVCWLADISGETRPDPDEPLWWVLSDAK